MTDFQNSPIYPDPASCHDMADVRAGVDAVDRAIVELLQHRFAYMDAAARIKSERHAVRDEARKAEVIANVTAQANLLDIPDMVVSEIWEHLVEASISYEMQAWDKAHGQ